MHGVRPVTGAASVAVFENPDHSIRWAAMPQAAPASSYRVHANSQKSETGFNIYSRA
jgi:hypothetical protein